jgi:hypothetical protein
MSATLAGAHVAVSLCVAICLSTADPHASCHRPSPRAQPPAASDLALTVAHRCCAGVSIDAGAILPAKLARWSAQPVLFGPAHWSASSVASAAARVAAPGSTASQSPPRTPLVLRI